MSKWSEHIKCVDDPADPHRCQAITGLGQCNKVALNDLKYCPLHAGAQGLQAIQRKNLYDFKRTQLLSSAETFLGNPNRFSLTEELAVSRMILNEYLAKLETPADLLVYNNLIQQQIMTIKSLIQDALKLDTKLKELLSKEELMVILGSLVEAIAEVVEEPENVDKIVSRFNVILGETFPE